MRRVILGILASLFFTSVSFAGPQQVVNFHDQLEAIQDANLRRTLENSIAAGLIDNQQDFSSAVSRAEAIGNNGSTGYYSAFNATRNINEIRNIIAQQAKPLAALDRDAVKVNKNEDYRKAKLFLDFTGTIPESYTRTVALCEMFNPKNGTNDHARLDNEIDEYLASIQNDPTIVSALKATNTTIKDLKSNWFGSGRGFEHVIAGEIDGKKVSGYHWWYKFYHDERNDRAQVKSAVAGVGNPLTYTGSFFWDPDGSEGPLPSANKPKGGFINRNSPQVILALGHIAIEATRKFGAVPGALSFNADINGEEFRWQLYTMGGNIRSLYPMGSTKGGDVNPPGEDEIHYDYKRNSASAGAAMH